MGTNLRAPYASFMRRLQHLAHNSVWKHILLIKRARQIEGHGRSTGVERQQESKLGPVLARWLGLVATLQAGTGLASSVAKKIFSESCDHMLYLGFRIRV